MTDSDPKLPDPAGAGAPPPAPPGPPAGAAEPVGGMPGAGQDPVASGAADAAAGTPGMEATTQMPVTGAPEDAAGAGVPPVGPDDTALDGDGDDEVPWYKKPAGIAGIAILVLAILGLIAWLIWGGGDDDEASPETSRLTIESRDETGALLDRGFLINVVGPAGSERSYTWLRPEDATPGETTGADTGTDGRVDFEWEPDDTVADPATWAATVDLVESIPPGWTPPGPLVECALQRVDEADSVVSMAVELVSNNDPEADQLVAYTFPNYTFLPGDAVRCNLTSTTPVETTTTSTTTTTVADTTTTVVDTTVPEDTTTTVVETTVAPTTAPPATTAPPTVPATAIEALTAAGNFTEFLAAVDTVPTVKALLEGPGPITVFAPVDGKLVPPADAADLEALLMSHIVDGEALDAAAVTDGRTEVTMQTGGDQAIDGTVPSIGGVDIIEIDIESTNGWSHGIDGTMPIVP